MSGGGMDISGGEIQWDMVGKWVVRIVLECFIVILFFWRFVDTAQHQEAETETDLDTDKNAFK